MENSLFLSEYFIYSDWMKYKFTARTRKFPKLKHMSIYLLNDDDWWWLMIIFNDWWFYGHCMSSQLKLKNKKCRILVGISFPFYNLINVSKIKTIAQDFDVVIIEKLYHLQMFLKEYSLLALTIK